MKVVTFHLENIDQTLKKADYEKKDFAGTEYVKQFPKGQFHIIVNGKELKLHYDKCPHSKQP
jgi:TATA-box binding protein (TBP) (component of TFIID and TFIIIB)